MWFAKSPILKILDDCAKVFTFPLLDNGYVYLAATRLSLYASKPDWAMVIEVFGFSPRGGLPDIAIYTFASRLFNRDRPENYVTHDAHAKYLARNPHNEFRSAFPIDEGDWHESDNPEVVAPTAREVSVRGEFIPLPKREEYAAHGIALKDPARVHVYELCRFLAGTMRSQVLGTAAERRISVLPELQELLILDEWNHPDVAGNAVPSDSKTFQQFAEVLETGDAKRYRPVEPPNTHWSNWPESGLL